MSDEDAFLAALKLNPADDTARLVYADWLDEYDEPQKAQYIRAVADLARLGGGSVEYTAAAVRLYTTAIQTDSTWRKVAGARFDVVLEGYDAPYKIHAIKIIRECTGCGLGEAKALAESAPTSLFSWLPFEESMPHLLAFDIGTHQGGLIPIRAAIRPTPWPEAAPGAVFDVVLCASNFAYLSHQDVRIHNLASVLNVSVHEAIGLLNNLPAVVGAGLQPAKVADFVRHLKRICSVTQALPTSAIRVVPRLPTS